MSDDGKVQLWRDGNPELRLYCRTESAVNGNVFERIYACYTDTSNWERIDVRRNEIRSGPSEISAGITLRFEHTGTGSPRSICLLRETDQEIEVCLDTYFDRGDRLFVPGPTSRRVRLVSAP